MSHVPAQPCLGLPISKCVRRYAWSDFFLKCLQTSYPLVPGHLHIETHINLHAEARCELTDVSLRTDVNTKSEQSVRVVVCWHRLPSGKNMTNVNHTLTPRPSLLLQSLYARWCQRHRKSTITNGAICALAHIHTARPASALAQHCSANFIRFMALVSGRGTLCSKEHNAP